MTMFVIGRGDFLMSLAGMRTNTVNSGKVSALSSETNIGQGIIDCEDGLDDKLIVKFFLPVNRFSRKCYPNTHVKIESYGIQTQQN